MYGYIYKTTNLITGKIYIGKKKSEKFNPEYLGSGKCLNNSIRKHGGANFTVELMFGCSNKKNLNLCEKIYIWSTRARDPEIGYNIAKGGEGGTGWARGSEARAKAVETKQKNGTTGRGVPKSLEHKEKNRQAHIGKKPTPEACAKAVETRRKNGYWFSEETKEKISKANRKLTDEQVELAFHAFNDGWDYDELGFHFGVCKETIMGEFKKRGETNG